MMLANITMPCLVAATASMMFMYVTFGMRDAVVDIWDRRIERWVEAWEKEKLEAERAEWAVLQKMADRREGTLVDLWERVQRVRGELELGERKKELLVWRRGMKEGKGYGPDYWLPREKGA